MPEITMTPEEFAARIHEETITGYLIDVDRETAQVVTVPKELQSYYKLLSCSTIAITEHRIGVRTPRNREPHFFNIVSDDEALLTEAPKISAIDNMGNPMLCGNLLIVKSRQNEIGEVSLAILEPQDIEYLKQFILLQATRKYPRPYPMLHQCEYC